MVERTEVKIANLRNDDQGYAYALRGSLMAAMGSILGYPEENSQHAITTDKTTDGLQTNQEPTIEQRTSWLEKPRKGQRQGLVGFIDEEE